MRSQDQGHQETTGIGRAEGAEPIEQAGLLLAIVEGTPDAVFVKDLEGRYLLVNSACVRILGRPKEEIVGRTDAQILPPETAERLAEVDRLVLDTGEASSYEEVLPVAGRPRTYLSTKSVHRDAAGNALGIIGISRNITERKMAEQELMRSEERLRGSRDQLEVILRGVADGVTAQDASGRLIYANEAAARLVGYPSAKAFLEAPVSEVMAGFEVFDEEGRPFPLASLPGRRALSGEEGAEQLMRFKVLATGEERWSVVRAEPVFDERREVRVAVNIFRDVTERKRAEEAAFEVREAERSRLARDLHDGPLQDLSVVVQRLEIRRFASGVEGPDLGLDREIDALRRAVRGLREAVYDLRPSDEASFLERLEEMVRRYRDLTPEREIDLVVEEGFPPGLPEGVATQLLRLVREALTNARQHSAARHVRVSLGADGEELSVEVADDGRGFVAETIDGGMGLSTMRERAALLGGEVEVSSEPGGGTRVRLRLARPDAP